MTVSRRDMLVRGAVLVPAAGLLVPAAFGQQVITPATPAGGAAPVGGSPNLGEDPLLAACLLIDGYKQIQNCQFAKEHLTHDDAKAFAQAEIDEHENIKNQLSRLGYALPAPAPAATGGAVTPAGTNSAPTTTPAATPPGGTVGAPAATAPAAPVVVNGPVVVGRLVLDPGASSLVRFSREVADQCIANFKTKMTQKKEEKGEFKFDKAFIGHQLHEHMTLLDKAQVAQRKASGQMKPVLNDGLAIINQHIRTLEGIMAKFDQRQAEKGSSGSNS